MASFNPAQDDVDIPQYYKDVDSGSRPGGGGVARKAPPAINQSAGKSKQVTHTPIEVPTVSGLDTRGAQLNLFADVLGQTIDTVDEYYQQSVREDVENAVDAANAGVPGFNDLTSVADLPSEVTATLSDLNDIKARVDAGLTTRTAYWGQLAAKAKQLKSKYAGYRDEIDQEFSRLSGSKPANALRAALLSGLESSGGGMQKLEQQLAKSGDLPDDYFERKASGNPYGESELLQEVNSRRREKWNYEFEVSQYKHNKELGKDVKQEGGQLFYARAQKVTDDYARTEKVESEALGGLATIDQLLDAHRLTTDPNQKGKLEADITQYIAQARFDLEQNLRSTFTGPISESYQDSWSVSVDNPVEVYASGQKAINAFVENLEKTMNLKGNGLADVAINAVAGAKNQGLRNIVNNDPDIAVTMSIGEAFKDNPAVLQSLNSVGAKYAGQGPRIVALAAGDVVKVNNTGQVVRGSVLEVQEKINQESPDMPSKDRIAISESQAKIFVDAVESGKANPALIETYAKKMFGPGNERFIAAMPLQDKAAHFRALLTSEVRDVMSKLKVSEPDIYNDYTNWAEGQFLSLIQSQINEMNKQSSDSRYNVMYDPEKWQFSYLGESKRTIGLKGIPTTVAPGRNFYLERTVGDINSAMATIAPIIEERGLDPETYFIDTFLKNGLALNEKSPTIGETVVDMFVKGFKARYKEWDEWAKDPYKWNPGNQWETGSGTRFRELPPLVSPSNTVQVE